MRLPYALVALFVAPVAWVWGSGSAGAAIRIESESAEVERGAGIVRFSVRFDGVPDFATVDEFGRVADSFQYEIDGDWRAPLGLPPEGLDAVVRGDEIHVAGDLRIRDAGFAVAPDPDPDAGGWGDVRAEVPFELVGTELRFQARLAEVGDEGDGYFAYRVFTTEYGLTTSEVESRLLPPGEQPTPGPIPIPLPAALPATAAAGVTLLVGAWLVRRQQLFPRPVRRRPH